MHVDIATNNDEVLNDCVEDDVDIEEDVIEISYEEDKCLHKLAHEAAIKDKAKKQIKQWKKMAS